MRAVTAKGGNVVNLWNVFETSESIDCILDLLSGGSLYDLLKSEKILSSKDI
jgi:hypothetical protein